MEAQPDAILLLSFGGPEGMNEVMPFLENVLRGKHVPEERMRVVASHYEHFGGVSPINGQNRALLEALRAELARHGPSLPVYWGNRNWPPYLPDTLREMAGDGIKSALAFVTSAYSSYSGCRQYREDIVKARAEVGEAAPEVHKLRVYYNHPAFIEANTAQVEAALELVPSEQRASAALVFTAHSVPLAMAKGSDYEAQLHEVASLVAAAVGRPDWTFAYQSRSGPPQQPWLEPDIGDHLKALAAQGVRHVVVAPTGFVSDHMEVIYDLDTEAQEKAKALGLRLVRAATPGTHPAFVRMIRELVAERMGERRERVTLGGRGPSPDLCRPDCCPAPVRPAPGSGQRPG
jgi:protoporphyrin/coproporphyrin ferrochelatase